MINTHPQHSLGADSVISIDERGFVHVEGVLVCRYDAQRGALEFVDKDRRRCSQRGCRFVYLPLAFVGGLPMHDDGRQRELGRHLLYLLKDNGLDAACNWVRAMQEDERDLLCAWLDGQIPLAAQTLREFSASMIDFMYLMSYYPTLRAAAARPKLTVQEVQS